MYSLLEEIQNSDDIVKIVDERFNELQKNCNSQRVCFPLSYGGVFRDFYEKEKNSPMIEFSGGIDGEVCGYQVDNTKELVFRFIEKYKSSKCENIYDLCKIITSVIYDYIGGPNVVGTYQDRVDIANGERLSAFKNSQNAWCQERAVMAHQLFKMIGLDSELAMSQIWLDETITKKGNPKFEPHAYNLIKYDGVVYLFDATLVDYSKDENEHTSIVCELPLSAYDDLKNIPVRRFKSKDFRLRSCVYNPGQKYIHIIKNTNAYQMQ